MKKILVFFLFFICFNFYVVFWNSINIPKIIIEIQSWLQDLWSDEYKCNKQDCKINLSVEKIFTWTYDKWNYDCLWDFWSWTFSTLDTNKKCNPWYVNYWTWKFHLGIKVFEKNNESNFNEKLFKIINIVENQSWEDNLDSNSWWLDESTNSGSTNPWNTNSGTTNSAIKLETPKILWAFQNPSYLLNKDDILDNYICDKSKNSCKVNLDLRDSFTWWLNEKDFLCEIDFGFWSWVLSWEENKCNPSTVVFWTWSFDLKFKIISKNDISLYSTWSFIIKNDYNEEISSWDLNDKTSSWWLDESTNSGSTNPWNTNSGIINSATKLETPKVLWSFQNPSYLLNKDDILDNYICDKFRDSCKVNLDLRDSFTWWLNEKDFLCEIDFGFWSWVLSWEENKCNPSMVVFWTWIFDLKFKITSRNNTDLYSTWSFIIENNKIAIIDNPISSWWWNSYKPKQSIILNNIIVQSWLKLNSKNQYFCDKKICSVNLNYENNNKNLLCHWYFWGWIFSTKWTDKKCNPGYVKFGVWKHKIKLKVYDKNYKSNFKELFFEFENIFWTQNLLEEKKEKDTKLVFDYNKIKNLKFWNISVNPQGNDNFEYIEIINNWVDTVNLKHCILDDKLKWGSKQYIFYKDYFVFPRSKKKIYRSETKLNLNNKWDEVNLFCWKKLIDKIKWNFTVKSWYLVNHKNTQITSSFVKVIGVVDWDTVIIKFEDGLIEKLRLIWVDTPEIKDPRKPVQFFWLQASNYTKKELLWKKVYLEIDKNNYRDKYSRLLWYIYLDWYSFNKKLVKNWYAQVYEKISFKYLDEYKTEQIFAKKNKLGMRKFIGLELEDVFFKDNDKYLKNDLNFKKLEKELENDLKKLKQIQDSSNFYYEFANEIDLIYSDNLKTKNENINWIPYDFLEYRKATFIEKNILFKTFKKMNILFDDNKIFKNKLKKYKIVWENIFILDEIKSIDNYIYFVNNNFKINISKLKSWIKIYWRTVKNSNLDLSLKDFFVKWEKQVFTLQTKNSWFFSIMIKDIEKINSGVFEIKAQIMDEFWNEFHIDKNKKFSLSKSYVLDLKLNFFEKQYEDKIKTFKYLEKNLINLEKDFNRIVKKEEKKKIKLLKKEIKNKKKKKNIKKKIKKLPWEKLKKVQIYDKKQSFEKQKNKNWIFYYFIIILFGFVLFFIILKRNKLI